MKPSSAMALASRISGHCACATLGDNTHIELVRATANTLARIVTLNLPHRGTPKSSAGGLCSNSSSGLCENDSLQSLTSIFLKLPCIRLEKSALGHKNGSVGASKRFPVYP